MSVIRKMLFLISLVLTAGVLATVVVAGTYFAYYRPKTPNPAVGQIYPYRYHRTTVYLTKAEKCVVGPTMNLIGFGSTAVTIALGVLWRRDLPFGWGGQTEGRDA